MTAGGLLLAGVAAADFLTGNEISFSLFYLIPILLVGWFVGRFWALAISVLAGATWLAVDALSKTVYSRPAIQYWNATVRFGFFLIVAWLLPALKALRSEREAARVDYLTGAANRRSFFELAQRELDRLQRYKRPFTIAYIDLDGFKTANDRLGHRVGDKILCAVVDRAQSQLRKSDVLVRLGGDEFILFLPETDAGAAPLTVSKVHTALLDEMRRGGWPVTFSIGVLTCLGASIDADELLRRADDLMYSVKKSGKNAIAYGVLTG
jgi:diguanylate cyclase (GGDEF)-like protein